MPSFNFLHYYEDAVERTRRFKTRRELDEALEKRREKETKVNTLKPALAQLETQLTAKLTLDDVPTVQEIKNPLNGNFNAAATHKEPTIFTSPSDDLSGLADDPSTSNASCID